MYPKNPINSINPRNTINTINSRNPRNPRNPVYLFANTKGGYVRDGFETKDRTVPFREL